ncbi:hypothetical protein DH2020_036542 [Rehmannia glutinosa]|uniref:SAWADEE domain-containing protein n=1 Tax=Rehmannia glutinosa TaxID=99300 RepID=A0ABR0V5U4_REHGL
MEKILDESKEQSLDDDFFKKLAKSFNYSNNRAGKPVLKWTEVQSWFQKKQKECLLKETSFDSAKKLPVFPEILTQDKATENLKLPEGEKGPDLASLEFEARSSTDGAWYDVDTFLSHRFISSGGIVSSFISNDVNISHSFRLGLHLIIMRIAVILKLEVYVRYAGFGAEEDEWVSVKNDVRERSVALEHSECQKVKVGDLVVCFQERQDQARYYDAHVIAIQRRLHDIRDDIVYPDEYY